MLNPAWLPSATLATLAMTGVSGRAVLSFDHGLTGCPRISHFFLGGGCVGDAEPGRCLPKTLGKGE